MNFRLTIVPQEKIAQGFAYNCYIPQLPLAKHKPARLSFHSIFPYFACVTNIMSSQMLKRMFNICPHAATQKENALIHVILTVFIVASHFLQHRKNFHPMVTVCPVVTLCDTFTGLMRNNFKISFSSNVLFGQQSKVPIPD